MFDKLIESNSEEAEFKPRRKFFMVSSVVVGILFVTALVASLYAQNIDLGTDSFDMAELLAPVATDAPEPEPPRQQPQQQPDQQVTSELPVRRELIAPVDTPYKIPNEISTRKFEGLTIPEGQFVFDPNGIESNGSRSSTGTSSADSGPDAEPVAEVVKPPAPAAAVVKPTVPKAPVSIGVANGKATHLPKPPYSPVAIAAGAGGEVTVQVTIDETGKVISAKAVSGHVLLRQASERAAWNARFTPTTLSNVPIKVTGVIVYKFSRN